MSMTSWLVAPQWTYRPASPPTFAVSAFASGIASVPADGGVAQQGRHVEQLDAAGGRDRLGGLGRDHAGPGLGAGQRRLEVEHPPHVADAREEGGHLGRGVEGVGEILHQFATLVWG